MMVVGCYKGSQAVASHSQINMDYRPPKHKTHYVTNKLLVAKATPVTNLEVQMVDGCKGSQAVEANPQIWVANFKCKV